MVLKAIAKPCPKIDGMHFEWKCFKIPFENAVKSILEVKEDLKSFKDLRTPSHLKADFKRCKIFFERIRSLSLFSEIYLFTNGRALAKVAIIDIARKVSLKAIACIKTSIDLD